MVVSPARKITIDSPVCCHDQATITDQSAVSGFASHAKFMRSAADRAHHRVQQPPVGLVDPDPDLPTTTADRQIGR